MKTFICQNFTSIPCSFVYTGEENDVVNHAVDHLVQEHGYQDTPQLRKDVLNSLVDAT